MAAARKGATNLELQMRPGPAACTGISGAEQWDRGCGRAGDGGAKGGSGVREQGAELGERSRGLRQNGKRPILLFTRHNLKSKGRVCFQNHYSIVSE